MTALLVGVIATPVFAQTTYERRTGAVRSGTAVQGAYGNDAQHARGPRGAGTSVQGNQGGEVNHVRGPAGAATTVKTPSGQSYSRSRAR